MYQLVYKLKETVAEKMTCCIFPFFSAAPKLRYDCTPPPTIGASFNSAFCLLFDFCIEKVPLFVYILTTGVAFMPDCYKEIPV